MKNNMKNNKPVFESFNEFIKFIYEAEGDDAMDFRTFLSSNSSFLDADAKKGFEAARISATKAILSNLTPDTLKEVLGNILGGLDSWIKTGLAANDENKDSSQMSEKTTSEVKTVIYPALINGKVSLTSNYDVPFSDFSGKLDDSLTAGEFADINDLLTQINIANIYRLEYTKWDSEDGDLYVDGGEWPNTNGKGKNKEWATYAKSDYIFKSGAMLQYVISSIASGIDVNSNAQAVPGNEAKIIPQLAFKNKTANKSIKKQDEKAYTTLVLYGIGNIVQGAGDTIPSSFIKKDFTTETVIGKVKAYQVPIDGGDAMFAQGSATINTKNKVAIDKILTAALAPLAGKPESIVITGGASYEPDGQGPINKGLVVDRANAVKTYLEALYPALKGAITVNDKDFSKIQATDTPADYEKFRKVYLDIKGVLQGETYTVDKEIEYLVDGEIKCDSVEIIQYAISFEFDLPNDKDKVTMSDAD
jgi:flagellar motor protein MotB